MKKHFLVFGIILYVFISCCLLYNVSNISVETSSQNNLYGKIISNNAMLLKMPTKIEDYTNSYFLLEESYFVNIINQDVPDYYYVNYLNLTGYVKKNDIQLVNEQISLPYLQNIKFDIIKDCYLCSEPKNLPNAQVIKLSPQAGITFYGKMFGDEIYKNSGNVWYYCSIENNDKIINGYIHSSFTNNLTPITQNQEITTNFISQTNVNNLLNLNLTSQTLIIIIISLPILILLFILLKGFKKV